MKLDKSILAKNVAKQYSATLIGNENLPITGINEIHRVEFGDLTFVDHPKYYDKVLKSAATCIVINKEVEAPEGKTLLVTNEPFKLYNELVKSFQKKQLFSDSNENIHTTAIIHHGAVVESGVKIGKNSIVFPNVTIYNNVEIGENVIIHANSVIGSDAFYYHKDDGIYTKMTSCGKVIIGDNVEIGANCTIDKGVSGLTKIGNGTKIDNLCHIGHGVEIGNNCLFAAQVGIAGKTIVGNNVSIWGQVGVSKGLKIEDNVTILAKSGVHRDLEQGKTYFGAPVMEAKEKMKELVYIKRLPKLFKK